MSKESFFHRKLSGSMAASIGAASEPTSPLAVPTAPIVEDQNKGRTRMREAGYMLLEHIVPDPDQVRTEFNEQSLERLAKSITRHGLLQPIEVRWNAEIGKHMIMHGERRYRASKLAGLESVPCIFRDQEMTDSEKMQRQLTENCLREDLTPMEQAKAFSALKSLNAWNDMQLAEALSLSRSLVSQRLALLQLPASIQLKVEEGSLSGSAAYQVSQISVPEQQLEAVEKIATENLNRDQVVAMVKEAKRGDRGKGGAGAKSKGGRPTATTKSFKTSTATVTIKLSRKRVTDHDLLAAIDEVRAILLEKTALKAA